MHFAERRQEFARGQQQGLAGDVARGQDVVHAAQDVDGQVDMVVHELVGHGLEIRGRMGTKDLVELARAWSRRASIFLGVVLLLAEKLVDAGLAAFLVFEELVGHAAVGRDHVYAAITRRRGCAG